MHPCRTREQESLYQKISQEIRAALPSALAEGGELEARIKASGLPSTERANLLQHLIFRRHLAQQPGDDFIAPPTPLEVAKAYEAQGAALEQALSAALSRALYGHRPQDASEISGLLDEIRRGRTAALLARRYLGAPRGGPVALALEQTRDKTREAREKVERSQAERAANR
jgi:hypothetical protein